MSSDQPAAEATLPFGRFLKFWRGVHKVSQEELALRLDSASRHISRLENGGALPGKAMVLKIAHELSLGERDTNHLLFSAGYAPSSRKIDFLAPELKWLRKAMTLTLRALDPYPTTLTDGASNIVMVNKAWVGLFCNSIPADEIKNMTTQFDFLFHQMGASKELDDTISVILMSLQQSILLSGDNDRQESLEKILSSPFVPQDWKQRAARLEPMSSFRVTAEFMGEVTSFFSVSQTVGALGPNAFVSEPNLIVTTFYPEDDNLDLSSLISDNLEHALLYY